MFKFYKQYNSTDCGPACIKMLVKHYGKDISMQQLRDICNTDREGTSIAELNNALQKLGFKTLPVKISTDKSDISLSVREINLPVIIYWNDNHFVVLYKITNNNYYIADPAVGLYKVNGDKFKLFCYNHNSFGKAIIVEPQNEFYNNCIFENQSIGKFYSFVHSYVSKERRRLIILFIVILLQLVMQIFLPFLTQYTFDFGVIGKDISALYIVLGSQLIVLMISSLLSYINSILSNKIALSINVSLTKDYITKIFKIPFSFFKRTKTSDFINKGFDISRIESFLTYNFVTIVLSILGIFIYSCISAFYNYKMCICILTFGIVSTFWSMHSIKKRKIYDYERYDIKSDSFKYMSEIFEGMYDIKMYNATSAKIEELTDNQKKFFNNNLKFLKNSQLLSIGNNIINTIGSSTIMFYSAMLTINNTLSIGEMAAIQLISTQLFSMLNQFISSFTTIIETKFSIERILETYLIEEEKIDGEPIKSFEGIILKNVSFSYLETGQPVIKNVNLEINKGETIAIVGASGSGKTTIMKILLGLIEPTSGWVLINNKLLKNCNVTEWRSKCGVIFSDSFIFTDSIQNNITMNGTFNTELYNQALMCAGIDDFVNNLPIKSETIIGKEGYKFSSGQLQRILLARLFYKNPDVIMLDEATNKLDSLTEDYIVNNIDNHFHGKTKIIIAHRLSTIKNADKIIVMDDGSIVESGTHLELLRKCGKYYELMKKQFVA